MFKGMELLEYLVVPLIAAVVSFILMLYFLVAGKQLTKQYRFYILFLLGITHFMLMTPVQYFFSDHLFWALRYTRIPVLFGLAAPSLIIATTQHCRFRVSVRKRGLLFLFGSLFGLGHFITWDLSRGVGNAYLLRLSWVSDSLAEMPGIAGGHIPTWVQAMGGLLLLVVPFVFLLFRELRGDRRTNPLMFIAGVLLFGIMFVAGTLMYRWTLYYLACLACSGIWGWAIFGHIHEMRDIVARVMRERMDAELPSEHLVQPVIDVRDEGASVENERIAGLMEQAREFIFNNYQNDLSVDDIARSAHLSASHFSRLFKLHVGKTVKQYLIEVRIEHAKIMLTKKSVSDTAFAVGFNDSNYFSTAFKKYTGQSPSQFCDELKR